MALLSSVSDAIAIVKKLKEVSDKIKNAELMNLLADLNLHLAEIKMQLAEVTTENVGLRASVRALESVDGDPCPKCHKRGWNIEKSAPHPVFHDVGGIERTYKCSVCSFTEKKTVV